MAFFEGLALESKHFFKLTHSEDTKRIRSEYAAGGQKETGSGNIDL